MRAYALFALGMMLVVSTSAPRAADGDRQVQVSASNDRSEVAILDSQVSGATRVDPKNVSSLTDAELRARLVALQVELAKRKQKSAASTAEVSSFRDQAAKSEKPKESNPAAYYQQKYLRELGYPREAAANPVKTPPSDPCNPQRIFLRENQLDNYLYGITPASKAKGASISYTDNLAAKSQNAVINGMLSYVLLRDLCPLTPAGSTGRCNTGVKSLCWGFESQGFPWPFV
jgi:hypothetical protein